MCVSKVSQSRLIDLRGRAGDLAESLLHDPNRPFWQAEIVRILCDLTDILDALASDQISSDAVCADLSQRLASVETRYSDLLYRMSERA